MHELSVCRNLMAQVQEIAAQHQARAVDSIYLQIGPLSGVVPELLQSAFAIASRNSVADGASLIIDASPVRVLCQRCGVRSDTTVNHLVCRSCGDWHTQLISGDELMLQRVVLSTEH